MDLPPGIKWYGYQLVDNYLRLGVELWGRSWNNASESFRQTFNELGRSVVQPRSVEHLFRTVLREYSNFVTGMIMVLPLAADSAAARTDSARRTFAPENPVAMDGGAPLVTGAIHELPGKGTDAEKTPFVTPARIMDASQGWAVYVVPHKIAAEILDSSVDFVTPFDLGGGRTLLAVLGTEYRVTDFGQYREIALALAVTAQNDLARIPGVLFVSIAVSGEFSRDAARAVWGLRKTLNEDLSVTYHPDSANFELSADKPQALSITFPRFGEGRFDRVPVLIYSQKSSADRYGVAPLQSVLSLSGRGQGLQIGGSVSIRLGTDNRAECVCRGSVADCLCRMLEAFDVKDRLPAANGWTEHLSGTLDEPRVFHLNR